jgi:hypothetical protein
VYVAPTRARITLGTVPGQLAVSVSGIRDRSVGTVDDFCA